ncbi:protein tilB homolog [Gigantopelta aegis]|uniref:protein tilB homolog n=1 Tax=Gigantopelta aegis TaxID=1735272 RepID=UPI001B88AA53|nr:protein tilB homolog [Gigantopelta aegis]
MTKITEDLIRKRAEHNNLEISTLEEISLHQQDIERIEYIDKWCRELKILYLQSNLIPRIENVGRLKKLEYLNLALNNIEIIENLEGCESLNKLDLTVNFIGELTSIETLKENYNFRELFLTGNPCTEYEGYKEYVIATLPQLKWLDGREIEKSERIQAVQEYGEIRPHILEQQEEYRRKREKQKEEAELKKKQEKEKKPGFDGRWYTDINEGDTKENKTKEKNEDDTVNKEFWDEKVAFTPESRIEVHEHIKKQKEKQNKSEEKKEKKPRKMFSDDGTPFNVNEAKLDFALREDEDNNKVVLDLAVYRHMDTSLLDCDIQTTYVRVTVKGKIFQLCLPVEVNPDSSTAQRSLTTGHLVISMPFAKPILKPTKMLDKNKKTEETNKGKISRQKEEHLEVDPKAKTCVDIGNIVRDKCEKTVPPLGGMRRLVKERENSEDFVDDLDVPPLM